MGQKGKIDGYAVGGHTSPDEKMGHVESWVTRGARKVIKHRAAKKRRQRDKQLRNDG
jgi:hypothetical protein